MSFHFCVLGEYQLKKQVSVPANDVPVVSARPRAGVKGR